DAASRSACDTQEGKAGGAASGRRAPRTRRCTVGRSAGRRQKPRGKPAAARARCCARSAHHRDPQLDLSGPRGARAGQGGRSGEEFRKALSINPELELAAAEAGHPAWGPVFSSLKAAPAPFKLALQQYEAGDYAESAKSFQGAIKEGLGDKERANAHKHLAFI